MVDHRASVQPGTLGQHGAQAILGGPGLGKRRLECLDRLEQRRNVLSDRWENLPGDVERPAFLPDLVQRDHLGALIDVRKGAIPGDDLLDVFGIAVPLRRESVPGPAPGIRSSSLPPPLPERERRIGDDAVEGEQPARAGEVPGVAELGSALFRKANRAR